MLPKHNNPHDIHLHLHVVCTVEPPVNGTPLSSESRAVTSYFCCRFCSYFYQKHPKYLGREFNHGHCLSHNSFLGHCLSHDWFLATALTAQFIYGLLTESRGKRPIAEILAVDIIIFLPSPSLC